MSAHRLLAKSRLDNSSSFSLSLSDSHIHSRKTRQRIVPAKVSIDRLPLLFKRTQTHVHIHPESREGGKGAESLGKGGSLLSLSLTLRPVTAHARSVAGCHFELFMFAWQRLSLLLVSSIHGKGSGQAGPGSGSTCLVDRASMGGVPSSSDSVEGEPSARRAGREKASKRVAGIASSIV